MGWTDAMTRMALVALLGLGTEASDDDGFVPLKVLLALHQAPPIQRLAAKESCSLQSTQTCDRNYASTCARSTPTWRSAWAGRC